MAIKNCNHRISPVKGSGAGAAGPGTVSEQRGRRHKASFRVNLLASFVLAFFAIGALGAGLKYLESEAKREETLRQSDRGYLTDRQPSLLNRLNPFLSAPSPLPTPQLSREYVYANGRLLAVEDANAAVAPPTDLAVWRPSSGVWWVLGGAGSQQFAQGWGQSGDIPTQGDYDGDGKTDLGVFRPAAGQWWIFKSSDGAYYSASFGLNGDKPAPADFDGDGRTDIAVFRPSNGNWYVSRSSSGATTVTGFGVSTDVPQPKDFDGDGRADVAVFRPSTATFFSLNSSDQQNQIYTFSKPGSSPVPADFDGDGRTDFAIREAGTSNWIIRESSTGQPLTVGWQQGSDTQVANDYDGDGKVDIAVWRNSDGVWLIRQSSRIGQPDELRQVQWGMSGDIPVPAFFRR